MKKIFIVLLSLCCGFTALCQEQLVVDANAEVRTLTGSFNAIKVSGGIDLYLSQSETEAIAVSASEEKYKSGIKTVIENNTLRIYYEGERGWSMKNRKVKAYVSFKELHLLEASGASDVVLAGKIVADHLEMRLSGASDFKGAVAVSSLKLDLSGASDVQICGEALLLSIQSSGASDVSGYCLVSDICEANASGASDIEITVNKELTARASGASEISYKGEAQLKENHKSGASGISKKRS